MWPHGPTPKRVMTSAVRSGARSPASCCSCSSSATCSAPGSMRSWGEIAGEVGGAIWVPLVVALVMALLTAGGSYAELVTKYPHAGGAAVFAQHAYRSSLVSFLVGGFCMLAAGGDQRSRSRAGVRRGTTSSPSWTCRPPPPRSSSCSRSRHSRPWHQRVGAGQRRDDRDRGVGSGARRRPGRDRPRAGGRRRSASRARVRQFGDARARGAQRGLARLLLLRGGSRRRPTSPRRFATCDGSTRRRCSAR